MNHLIKIIILVFVGCASKKDLNIQEIIIKEKKRESTIHVGINSVKGIVFLDMFYKNKTAKIKFDKQNKILVSRFKPNIPRDINLSANPREEYGNTIPILKKIPVMDENELIISYKKKDDKVLFYKINYQKFLDKKSSK